MTESRSSPARVRFLPSDREIDVPTGTHLTAAAMRARAGIVHDCDGQGVCGTCRVWVEDGRDRLSPIDARERLQLGPDVDRGWRLCCLVRVEGSVTVRVPEGGFAYPPELQR
jgi:2Fe-2S ferredoxin